MMTFHHAPNAPWRLVAALTFALSLLLLPAGGLAAPYYVGLTGGQNKNWSDSTAWSPAGVPGIGDSVIATNLPWPSSWTLNLDAGWAANSITFTSQVASVNNHNFGVNTDGTVNVLTVYNNNTTVLAQGFRWNQDTATTLTLREFHDLGNDKALLSFGGPVTAYWNFKDAAVITYHTTNSINQQLAVHLVFTNATSVLLQRSPTLGTVTSEVIQQRAGNGDAFMVAIGRADNGTQDWTVGPGSHPVLRVNVGSGRQALSKVGTGPVNMPDVDLQIRMDTQDGAINRSGSGWPVPQPTEYFTNTITANSLAVSPGAAAAARTFHVGGHLVLDGEAGLDGGGSGNGRAFCAIAGNYDLNLFFAAGQWSYIPGLVEITPEGGEFYLGSTGTGKVKFSIDSTGRDNATYYTNAILIANTINLASPNIYLSDRNRHFDTDAKAGGTIEFRGDFINQSTQTSLWRTDRSTLRDIGGGTFEAASQDLGTGAPATNPFQVGKLVLGQTAAGAVSPVTMYLGDSYDNDAGAAREAVYVDTLQLYGSSILDLRGLNLYFRNGSGNWVSAINYTNQLFTFANGGDGTGLILNTPEPSALLLVALGACLLGVRRK